MSRRALSIVVLLGIAAMAIAGAAIGGVGDTTPPTLTLPSTVIAEATGPGGAVVDYVVSAHDDDDPAPTVSCAPDTGSTFPIGTTPVSCTASDTSGNTTGPETFDVVVQDTMPPTVTIAITSDTQADGPAGAVLTYTVGATDSVDASPAIDCKTSPASGSTVDVGATVTIDCDATDDAGNVGNATAVFTAVDAEAPAVTVPASKTVEANGPNGAIVNYEAASATDIVDGPLVPTCTRPSGGVYPVGTTLVTCSATDSEGHVGGASFTITVEDTTPPVLTAPSEFAVQSSTPVAVTDPRIQAFLSSATATDIVDQNVEITAEAPETFPPGTTLIVFTATDDFHNTSRKTAVVTVSTRPVGPGQTDTVPPGDVRRVKAVSGNFSVLISWAPPGASDFDHVEITRSPGKNGEPSSLVYTGRKKTFGARGLTDGIEYRFVIVAFDRAGNRSAGVAVVVLAEARNLLSPQIGAAIKGKTKFAWRPVKNATYYNVQYWFRGKKQLSAHPSAPRFTLPRRWRYAGKEHRLTPGTWQVFVFPGFGPKRASRYGDVHVSAAFVVKRR